MTVGCKALKGMVCQHAVSADDFKALLGWGMLKISENTVSNYPSRESGVTDA
jgi:hypothetical protein